MMGPESKDSNPHDGLNFNDKLNDKPLSKYVVPKISYKGAGVVKGLNPTYKYSH